MKAPIALVFMDGDEVIAKSEMLIVLSKPPNSERTFPFARIISREEAHAQRRSPSRWILGKKDLAVVPLPKSNLIAAWRVSRLGTYRPVVPAIKRKREDEEPVRVIPASDLPPVHLDVEFLRDQLSKAESRILALEKEREGLSRALKMFAAPTETKN
jgi:hypothetical protein